MNYFTMNRESVQPTLCEYCNRQGHELKNCPQGQSNATIIVKSISTLFHLIQKGDILFRNQTASIFEVLMIWLDDFVRQLHNPILMSIYYYFSNDRYYLFPNIVQQVKNHFRYLWNQPHDHAVTEGNVIVVHNFFNHFRDLIVVSNYVNILWENIIIIYPSTPMREVFYRSLQMMDETNNRDFLDVQMHGIIPMRQIYTRDLRSRVRFAEAHMQNSIIWNGGTASVDAPPPPTAVPSVTEEMNDEYIPFRKVIQVEYNVRVKAINDVCSICLSNSTYITTQCRHGFCSCIMKHLKRRGFCPYCRDIVEKMYCSDEKCFDCMKNGNIDDDIFCFQ